MGGFIAALHFLSIFASTCHILITLGIDTYGTQKIFL